MAIHQPPSLLTYRGNSPGEEGVWEWQRKENEMKEVGVVPQELLFSHNGVTDCSGLSKWFGDREDKDGREGTSQPFIITPEQHIQTGWPKRWAVIY